MEKITNNMVKWGQKNQSSKSCSKKCSGYGSC